MNASNVQTTASLQTPSNGRVQASKLFTSPFPDRRGPARVRELSARSRRELHALKVIRNLSFNTDQHHILWMPPGPLYNWLTVAHSVADILEHAAQYRTAQLTCAGTGVGGKKRRRTEDEVQVVDEGAESEIVSSPGDPWVSPTQPLTFVRPSSLRRANEEWMRQVSIKPTVRLPRITAASPSQTPPRATEKSTDRGLGAYLSEAATLPPKSPRPSDADAAASPSAPRPGDIPWETQEEHSRKGYDAEHEVSLLRSSVPPAQAPNNTYHASSGVPVSEEPPLVAPSPEGPNDSSPDVSSYRVATDEPEEPPADVRLSLARFERVPDGIILSTQALLSEAHPTRNLQASKVPSSRIGRLFHYGGLAASLGYGAATEMLRRTASSSDSPQSSSVMMTEANITRLVSKLSKMRGAALKLGQFMSIQDTHVLPPEVEKVFRRVQDSAHYMPNWQMERVLSSSLGPTWRDAFTSFTPIPFAAASIGQVHHAVLAAHASPTGKDAAVAVKIQFPNIRESVESDLGYLKVLLTAGRLLPAGLFLEKTMARSSRTSATMRGKRSSCERSGRGRIWGGDGRYKVPWVWAGSTERVLVMEHVGGVSVGGEVVSTLSEADRNDIAARIIELCLKELFVFREMQTDPNWSNFLWNAQTRQVELVDFGATRAYSVEFIDSWLRLLQAAADRDREGCRIWSLKLGYLTGQENEVSDARRAHKINDATRNAVPVGHGAAIRVWSGLTVGGHHQGDPGADPSHAAVSADTAAEGDIQLESVWSILSFCLASANGELGSRVQEAERGVFVGIAAGGTGGLQADLG
ncbi:hypothetical protein EVG20_g2292 [Dentipellis fragilis]|uniref:ABC1 atypical kinase-like domain-containing protein n=1 Tax=Dentipellis fragilis TaxID=205917 RepID=A0A4Y9Z7J0_9AGAM|nr:hypothetical protein EVG20_g2292 [Dentipellis fragilis]